MPKQTFFNLPYEKRKSILETAVDEFAANDYQSASISHMVARLGIAKGSFYQYFEDKQDLYFYVLDVAMGERLAFAQQHSLADKEQDFFTYVQELLEIGFRYDLAHPRLGQIIYRAMFGNGPFQDETHNRLKESLLDYQRQVLKLGVSLGAIAPDINLDIAAHILNAIMADFGGFLVTHLQLDAERLVQGDYSQLDMAALGETLSQVMRIIRFGLANKNG
jgi:AcrR family transcriptional regulator